MSTQNGFDHIRSALRIASAASLGMPSNQARIEAASSALIELQALACACQALASKDFGFKGWGPDQERAALVVRESLDRLGIGQRQIKSAAPVGAAP